MDDKYLRNYRINIKKLEGIQMPGARSIALYITDTNPEREALSDEEIGTAEYIKQLINCTENINVGAVAKAIYMGKDAVEKVYNYFLKMGYSKSEVENFYKRNTDIFCFSVQEVEEQYRYLESIKLTKEQIKEIFFEAVCLGKEELKKRCECVLKYFSKDTLMLLAKNYMFYRYYTDPIDCIEYVVSELGVKKALTVFESEEMLLYLWKEEWQRNDWTHGKQHKEAIEIVNKYLNV